MYKYVAYTGVVCVCERLVSEVSMYSLLLSIFIFIKCENVEGFIMFPLIVVIGILF